MELTVIHEAIISGNSIEVAENTQKALDQGNDPTAILNRGLIAAMDLVGEKFASGDLYIPEMLQAAMAMKNGLKLLEPFLIAEKAKQKGEGPTGPPKTVWLAADGQPVDSNTLNSFLSSINNLMCENYLEGRQKDEFKNPIFEISLEGKQTYTLSIFKKSDEKDEAVPAISSFNAYPFTLSSDRLDRLKKTVAKLRGKKEASKEK